jgi:hypothetical protein
MANRILLLSALVMLTVSVANTAFIGGSAYAPPLLNQKFNWTDFGSFWATGTTKSSVDFFYPPAYGGNFTDNVATNVTIAANLETGQYYLNDGYLSLTIINGTAYLVPSYAPTIVYVFSMTLHDFYAAYTDSMGENAFQIQHPNRLMKFYNIAYRDLLGCGTSQKNLMVAEYRRDNPRPYLVSWCSNQAEFFFFGQICSRSDYYIDYFHQQVPDPSYFVIPPVYYTGTVIRNTTVYCETYPQGVGAVCQDPSSRKK